MASSVDISTYKPRLICDVANGLIDPLELEKRTLRFTYIDRATDFDHIEWVLDNPDGYLTHPDNICTGLLIRIVLGYEDVFIPWKAFYINRLNGGFGVYGRENSPVGSNERTITYFGRNRNAPGGRPAVRWQRKAKNPAAPKYTKAGKLTKASRPNPPTQDILGQEMLLTAEDSDGQAKPRFIPGTTTSECVTRLAASYGFAGPYAIIQPTSDHINGLVIPAGQSAAQYLNQLARSFKFIFKIDKGTLRWHSPTWKGAKHEVLAHLVYGDGRDITKLVVDQDFRLPMPGRITAKGINWKKRELAISDMNSDVANVKANISGVLIDEASETQKRVLTRHETFNTIAGSGNARAQEKAVQRWVERFTRAITILADCVGNPTLYATGLVDISGKGNPLLDRRWYISIARHNIERTYETQLTLKPPPRSADKNGRIIELALGDQQADVADQKYKRAGVLIQEAPVSSTKTSLRRSIPK